MSLAAVSEPDPSPPAAPTERLPPDLLAPTPRNFSIRTYGYCDKKGLDGRGMRLRSEFGNTIEGEREFARIFQLRINFVPRHGRG